MALAPVEGRIPHIITPIIARLEPPGFYNVNTICLRIKNLSCIKFWNGSLLLR